MENGFYKDFGYGFYCTITEKQAKRWALTKRRKHIVNLYEYSPDRMSELYELSLDELVKGDKVLLEKIERDVSAVKAKKKIIKFAWISIVISTILIILGEMLKGNPFIDFLNGALPWVLLGLMFLFAFLYLDKEEKDKE